MDRSAIGRSGAYLPAFVIPAIRRAFQWIDTLWALSPHFDENKQKQWETVVNLSYGQSAGPKDGSELLEREINTIINERITSDPSTGFPQPHIIMPVGNGNLERTHVELNIAAQAQSSTTVCIQPEDQTPTIIEFWTGAFPDPAWPIALGLNGIAASAPAPGDFDPGKFTAQIPLAGTPYGMAFARRHKWSDPDGNDAFRFQYVIIVNPTLSMSTLPHRVAPSGSWTMTLENLTTKALTVRGDIEVDQALTAFSATALRAYFVDPSEHQRFDPAGRAYDVGEMRQIDIDTKMQQVKQRGSHNALANSPDVRAISGHRRSDGQPAPYASAMIARDAVGSPSLFPHASRPCEDGPATPGVISAGIRSGGADHSTTGTSDHQKYSLKQFD